MRNQIFNLAKQVNNSQEGKEIRKRHIIEFIITNGLSNLKNFRSVLDRYQGKEIQMLSAETYLLFK
jgi:hypothetical protein